MLYQFLNEIFPISTMGYVFGAIFLAWVGMFVYLKLTNFFRIALVPFLLLEMYQMTDSFACNGPSGILFQRKPGTLFACDPIAYQHYVRTNFGVDQLYILLLYGLILLFMIWPLFTKIRTTYLQWQDQKMLRIQEHEVDAEEAARRTRIRGIPRV